MPTFQTKKAKMQVSNLFLTLFQLTLMLGVLIVPALFSDIYFPMTKGSGGPKFFDFIHCELSANQKKSVSLDDL